MQDQNINNQQLNQDFRNQLLRHTQNKLYQSVFTDVPPDSARNKNPDQKLKLSTSRFFYTHYPSFQDRKYLIPLLDSSGIQNVKQDLKNMTNHYKLISSCDHLNLLQLECNNNHKIYYQALNHYMSLWLLSMGYLTDSNKKYILGRIMLHLGSQGIQKASKLYKDMLKSSKLSERQRLKYLIEICKNGWEHFIEILIKIITEEKKIQQKNPLKMFKNEIL